jgi:hypothetical protein
MTNEQINIKIAELCGWKPRTVLYPGRFEQGWKKGRGFRKKFPNYAADLNACHEFEKTLTPEQQFDYVYELNDNALGLVPLSSPASYREGVLWLFLHTTARQRCEAFLRVHGQWEEEA